MIRLPIVEGGVVRGMQIGVAYRIMKALYTLTYFDFSSIHNGAELCGPADGASGAHISGGEAAIGGVGSANGAGRAGPAAPGHLHRGVQRNARRVAVR